MFNDDRKGPDGQFLNVIHSFSNDGARNLLDVFGLNNNHVPVLLTHKEEIIDDPDEIISYLKDNNLAD